MIKKLLILFIFNLLLFSQNIESFLSTIESESLDKKLELLSDETWENRSKNPLYAIECANVALALAVELNNKSKLAELNNYLGVIYRNIASYTKSIQYYTKALEIAKSINDSVQIAYSYNNIGGAYRLENNYTVALTNMFKSLEIFERLDHKEGIGFCAINIGIVYKHQGNYQKAMDYFNRSLSLREEIGDKFGKAITLNQIVEVSYEQGYLAEALKKYEELLKIYQDLNDTKGVAVAYGGIAGIKFQQKQYEEAKVLRETSLSINRKIQNTEGIINNLNHLSIIYLKLDQNNKAASAINESKQIAYKSDHLAFLMDFYYYYSKYFEEVDKIDSALMYYKKYSSAKDSLSARENMASIASMESIYQVDIAAKENKILQNENKLRNEQAIFLLFLAVILIAFVAFILFKYFQNKNLNKELKELNATKDKFFSIVAHDLKNPFNNLLGFSELLVTDYDSMTDDEIKHAVGNLNTSSRKLVALVDNLLQWARANIGAMKYNPKVVNLFLFFKKLGNVFDELLQEKEINVEYDIDPECEVFVDEDYLNLVMRNLFSNAIKFSFPNSKIKFSVEENDEILSIYIKDQGLGIERDKLEHLFELGENVSTSGTLNEKGTGLGLILSHDLVKKWGGTILVNSELEKGSTFIVTIPKKKKSS